MFMAGRAPRGYGARPGAGPLMIDSATTDARLPAGPSGHRLLLLFPASSYRVEAFLQAAERAGIDLWLGTDLPAAFARLGRPTVAVDLRAPEAAAAAIA